SRPRAGDARVRRRSTAPGSASVAYYVTTTRRRLPKQAPTARIAAVIERIPRGRVATYGEVAAVAGYPRAPRLVVYALKLGGSSLPRHRGVGPPNAPLPYLSIQGPRPAVPPPRPLPEEGLRLA